MATPCLVQLYPFPQNVSVCVASYDFSDSGHCISPPTPIGPIPPQITGPTELVTEGDTVVLICSTTDNQPINWTRVDGMPIDDLLVFMQSVTQDGIFRRGSLTIVDVQERNAGMYKCRVRDENALFDLQVAPSTSESDWSQ